nr:unnamed protein product [Digitaria exilis]
MPRKSSRPRGAAAQGPVGPTAVPRPPFKGAAPNPSPAAEPPQAAAPAVDEALERLHLDTVSDGDPPAPAPPEPEPEPEAPAPSPPAPVEASSSGRSAAGGSLEEEEALRKLHELAEAGGEEVALTDDEVGANDQRQEDEICALESIFGDAVVIFNRKGGQRCFQVHVHIEIPEAIDVSTRFNYGDGTLKYGEASDADDLVYKFRVEHLPPILLTCLLPASYPSHRPPLFTISSYWLDKGMISSLCHMLDMLWEEQQGMEVTYQWVQWLQSSSLSHLGFDNEIVLSKNDVACEADKRACLDNASPDVIIPRMMRYNENRHHEAFVNAIHDCMICFSECPGNSFTFVVSAKRQQSGHVQADQMRILEELRSLKEIMKDSKQCPKCNMAISKTEGCNKMECWNCKEYFCYQCNRAITGYDHFRCLIF